MDKAQITFNKYALKVKQEKTLNYNFDKPESKRWHRNRMFMTSVYATPYKVIEAKHGKDYLNALKKHYNLPEKTTRLVS